MSRRESRPALDRLYCPTCEREETSGELCPRDGTRLVRLASDHDPLVGRKLDDRFTIEEKLGAGGMGSVYRARQHSVGRDVAIKVVNPGLVTDPIATKRFLREAKLASRLSHPNVVSVLDFGQTADGLFYLVMELVHGRTLAAELAGEGRLKLDRLVRIASQICDALEGAHALPIMHRDLKPANIMLLAAGRDLVKVLDFGLAKSLAVDATTSTVTSAGVLLGTPAFMPPEVANGDAYDERADLYSLGCILYLMASGRPPFVTDSIPALIYMHGSAVPEPVTNVPWPVAEVIARLLAKSPDARYPSAAAVRTALEAAVEQARSEPIAIDEPAPPLPAPRPSEDALTTQRAAVAPPAETSAAPMRSSDARFAFGVSHATGAASAPRRRPAAAIAAAVIGVVALGGVIGYAAFGRGERTPTAAPVDAAAAAPARAAPVAPDALAAADAAVRAPDASPAPPRDAAAAVHHAPPPPPPPPPRTNHTAPHADAGVLATDAPF